MFLLCFLSSLTIVRMFVCHARMMTMPLCLLLDKIIWSYPIFHDDHHRDENIENVNVKTGGGMKIHEDAVNKPAYLAPPQFCVHFFVSQCAMRFSFALADIWHFTYKFILWFSFKSYDDNIKHAIMIKLLHCIDKILLELIVFRAPSLSLTKMHYAKPRQSQFN